MQETELKVLSYSPLLSGSMAANRDDGWKELPSSFNLPLEVGWGGSRVGIAYCLLPFVRSIVNKWFVHNKLYNGV